MTINEFIDKISDSTNDKIYGIVDCAINDFQTINDFSEINIKIKGIDSDSFTDFGDRVTTCLHICEKKIENIEGLHYDPYSEKLKSFYAALKKIESLIQAEGKIRAKKRISENKDYATVQNLEVIREQIGKLNEVQKTATSALMKVKKSRAELDSKVFQLLINTVAILGIFVAIAFTGFGSAAIFSNINLESALSSEEAFVKNVFFLLLVASLLYNLLLLLIYFVFKLSRPLLDRNSVNGCQQNNSFNKTINLLPFYIVDISLVVVTIGVFVVSICIW